jgi:NNP family nitrate/nitrite transporter-like MFS transporter
VNGKSYLVLGLDTLAFTACFALWMLNGVLVTYLVEAQVFNFDQVQIGWLMGIPVLTGSLLRLPVGLLTDRYGGRLVYSAVLVASALGALLLSRADNYAGFVLGSLAFGLAGTSFAVGIAHTSAWFPSHRKGTALGVFGAGNAGSALTAVFAPGLLQFFTDGGKNPEGWRLLPLTFAGLLAVMAASFFFLVPKDAPRPRLVRSMREELLVLRSVRVWRFGLYYFLVFGCFVALAQWLVPYYVNVFGMTLATAGLLTAVFSFPSGVVRALGGWLSDRYGARLTMYGVLASTLVGCLLLSVPSMQVTTPGEGVNARFAGTVKAVTADSITVGDFRYAVHTTAPSASDADTLSISTTQKPLVSVGDQVTRKQLLARGTTHIVFNPSVWLFTALVFAVGIAMGIGKAAVYKHIPDYFPDQVGAVGGLVGVIGGLGGFVCPILFGYLLRETGVWSSAWFFLFVLATTSLVWMHSVVRTLERRRLASIEASHDPVREVSVVLPNRGATAP